MSTNHNIDTAMAYYSEGGSDAPGSRYGTRVEDWGPVAFALAEVYADASGDPLDDTMLDQAASAVVNGQDAVADLIWDHRHAITAKPEDILHPDDLAGAIESARVYAEENG